MKKIFLMLAVVMTSLTTVSAQSYLDNVYLEDGVVLTDNQWHFNQYSVFETNRGYLLVTPYGYSYHHLPELKPWSIGNDVIISYSPYVYEGVLGYYVVGKRRNWFYYPSGITVELYTRPAFWDIHYAVSNLRCLDLRNWFWRHSTPPAWRPKPHHMHHPNPPYRDYNHSRPNHGVNHPYNPPRNHNGNVGNSHHQRPIGNNHGNVGNSHRPTPPRNNNGNVGSSSRPTPPKGQSVRQGASSSRGQSGTVRSSQNQGGSRQGASNSTSRRR
ncbi:MAG: hypothetical protein IJZ59_08220 [Alphaproteobacteria bacterium]|nr:hypothetical protein [Alphaproteobacteria bacterium]